MSLLSRTLPGRGPMRRQLEGMDEDDFSEDLAAFDEVFEQAAQWVPWDVRFMRAVQSHADRLDLFYEKAIRKSSQTPLPRLLWDNPDSRDIASVLGKYLVFCVRRSRHIAGNTTVTRGTLLKWVRILLFLTNEHILGAESRGTGRPPSAARGSLPNGKDSVASLMQSFIATITEKYNLPKKAKPTIFWGREEAFLLTRSCDYIALQRPASAFDSIQMKAMIIVNTLIGARTHSVSSLAESTLLGGPSSIPACAVTIHQPAKHVYDVQVSIDDTKNHSRADHDAGEDFKPIFPAAQRTGELQLELAAALIPLLLVRHLVYVEQNGERHYFPDATAFLASDASVFHVGDPRNVSLPLFTATLGAETPVSQVTYRDRFSTRATMVRLRHSQPYNLRHGAGDLVRTALGPDGQSIALHHGARRGDTGRRYYYRGVAALPIADIILGNWDDLPSDARQRLMADQQATRRRPSPAASAVVELASEPEIESLRYGVLRVKALEELQHEDDYMELVRALATDSNEEVADDEDQTGWEKLEQMVSLRIFKLRNDELRRLKRRPDEPCMTIDSTRAAYAVLDTLLASTPPLFTMLADERPLSLEAELRDLLSDAQPQSPAKNDLIDPVVGATFPDEEYDTYDEPPDMKLALNELGTSSARLSQSAECPPPNQNAGHSTRAVPEIDHGSPLSPAESLAKGTSVAEEAEPLTAVMNESSALARQLEVAPSRCRAIQSQFDLLLSRTELGKIVTWMREMGCCPLCPFHVAGFVGWRSSGANYSSFHPSTRGPVGVTTPDTSYNWASKHISTVHPDDWALIKAGQGAQVPWRSTPTFARLNDEELEYVAQTLNDMEDRLVEYHPGITTAVSEQKLEYLDVAHSQGLLDLAQLYRQQLFP